MAEFVDVQSHETMDPARRAPDSARSARAEGNRQPRMAATWPGLECLRTVMLLVDMR